jgi:peptidoglycan/LPS O-acetylase OafA/YrhL
MMDEGKQSSRRVPALDGLRALAIIGVLFCHVNNKWDFPAQGSVNEPVSILFGWGWVGVHLFFVLSGYLITGILYDAKGETGYFRNFYARRALRIMPLYFGYLLFALLILPLALTALPPRAVAFLQTPVVTRGDVVSLLCYFANFQIAFTNRYLGIFHPFWSLAVEEHFYLLWPLAVWSLSRRSLMRLCLGWTAASICLRAVIICVSGRDEIARLITPCSLDGLLAGGWLVLARGDRAMWAKIRPWTLPLLFGSAGFLLCLMLGQMEVIPDLDSHANPDSIYSGILMNTLGISVMAWFFAALTARSLDVAEGSRLRRMLEHPSLGAIGKYSYGIYVFHPLILLYIYRLSAVRFAPYVPISLTKLIVVAWLLSACFGVAWLSYHCYEIHFLRLKRFFENRPQPYSGILVTPQGQEA